MWSYLTVKVKRCNSTINPTCISDVDLAALEAEMGEFVFGLGFENVVVNPAESQYVKPMLEDRNMYSFSTSRGLTGSAYIV